MLSVDKLGFLLFHKLSTSRTQQLSLCERQFKLLVPMSCAKVCYTRSFNQGFLALLPAARTRSHMLYNISIRSNYESDEQFWPWKIFRDYDTCHITPC